MPPNMACRELEETIVQHHRMMSVNWKRAKCDPLRDRHESSSTRGRTRASASVSWPNCANGWRAGRATPHAMWPPPHKRGYSSLGGRRATRHARGHLRESPSSSSASGGDDKQQRRVDDCSRQKSKTRRTVRRTVTIINMSRASETTIVAMIGCRRQTASGRELVVVQPQRTSTSVDAAAATTTTTTGGTRIRDAMVGGVDTRARAVAADTRITSRDVGGRRQLEGLNATRRAPLIVDSRSPFRLD